MRDVQTQVLAISAHNIDPERIKQAAKVIQKGGLVVFPTETVYALAADVFNPQAVASVFEVKERPYNDPLIVHIAHITDLNDIAVDIPDTAFELAEAFWAGPLTMILKKNKRVLDAVTAGLDTVAIRMPNHPVTLKLIEAAGVPITGPSANLFTKPSPTRVDHVLQDLDGRVEIIIDSGATTIGVESTIIDLVSPEPRVLRPGGLPIEKLRQFFPDIQYHAEYIRNEDEKALSPGTHLKHYAPRARLLLYEGKADSVIKTMQQTVTEFIHSGKRVGLVLLNADAASFKESSAEIRLVGDTLNDMATNLFDAMRELDKREVDVILTYLPSREGVGLALWDRLLRAAEGRVIHCD